MPERKFEEAAYGSDSQGLVWGYRLSPGEPAVPIDTVAAAEWLEAPDEGGEGSFLWLHFSLANSAASSWLEEHLPRSRPFLDALQSPGSGTRLEQEGDAMLAVLHDVRFEFRFDAADVSTVTIWIERRLLVSARLRPLRSVDLLRTAIRAGDTFRSSADLLGQLLREQANVLVRIVRDATNQVDAIEDRLLAGQLATSRRSLGVLRRVLVRLQRLLAPEPAALFRVLSRPQRWLLEDDLQELRQAAEELNSAVADSSALAERVKLLQEEIGATLSERTNRTLFVLTFVTVLALPINLTAGLFGMNVAIPLATNPHGFAWICGALVVATGGLAYLAFRRRGH